MDCLLDTQGLPTPYEVVVALKSDKIDLRLLSTNLETPSPLAIYGRPFSLYTRYLRLANHDEWLNWPIFMLLVRAMVGLGGSWPKVSRRQHIRSHAASGTRTVLTRY